MILLVDNEGPDQTVDAHIPEDMFSHGAAQIIAIFSRTKAGHIKMVTNNILNPCHAE